MIEKTISFGQFLYQSYYRAFIQQNHTTVYTIAVFNCFKMIESKLQIRLKQNENFQNYEKRKGRWGVEKCGEMSKYSRKCKYKCVGIKMLTSVLTITLEISFHFFFACLQSYPWSYVCVSKTYPFSSFSHSLFVSHFPSQLSVLQELLSLCIDLFIWSHYRIPYHSK